MYDWFLGPEKDLKGLSEDKLLVINRILQNKQNSIKNIMKFKLNFEQK